MKKSAILALFLMIGCSHVETHKTVNFPFAPELLEKIQKNARMPASFTTEEVEGKSARRVYFSALYHQYLTMGQHLEKSREIKSCPAFHHDKVETDASVVPRFSLYKSHKVTSDEREFFPETAFNRDFSLEDHYAEMETEVSILCEDGVSDNYYKFDNLITHYAGQATFHSRPDSMKSVLKIPVFANYYLLQMFQAPHQMGIAHPEEKRVIEMTRTHWFEKYVAEAQRLRNNFIKHKMVQR